MIENYCYNYHNSIISSKIILKKKINFPKIKKIVIFFIVNNKYYNKSILLFYILIYISFFSTILLYNKERNIYQILKLYLKRIKILNFLNNFIVVYLPTLDIDQNIIKKCIINLKMVTYVYRIMYIAFPAIPESEFFCYSNEFLYNIINSCQVVFDIYLKNNFFLKNSLDFLLRIHRFPMVSKNIIN
jgi:hypothetical protein